MNFASDNWAGAAPEILAALSAVNDGASAAYGNDEATARVGRMLNDVFEREVDVFLVMTGSAANGLALAAMTPPWGAVLCHEASHIQTDECGGPEYFTHGAKLLSLPGENGKLSPDAVADALRYLPAGVVHHAQASALSLTQASEAGTVYKPSEIEALSAVARERGLKVHMDGARFANAVVSLNCSPADLTWKAGVDALVFGATKNGALAAEAVVLFDRDLARDFAFRRKRAGHLLSKGRFLAAQFEAYLDKDLWLRLAGHANSCAAELSAGLAALPGAALAYPTQANEIFVHLPQEISERLTRAGAKFYPWAVPGCPAERNVFRLVTSFATAKEEVADFLEAARG